MPRSALEPLMPMARRPRRDTRCPEGDELGRGDPRLCDPGLLAWRQLMVPRVRRSGPGCIAARFCHVRLWASALATGHRQRMDAVPHRPAPLHPGHQDLDTVLAR